MWSYTCGMLVSLLFAVSGCAHFGPNTSHAVAASVESRTGHAMRNVDPCETPLPPSIDLHDGLTEDEAALIGLWNNAAFLELLTDLDLSRADLIQAGQLTNPEVQTMFPLAAKQWEFALFVPLEALWVRPKRTAAAEIELQRVAERLVQDGLNVVRDVRVAHADWVLANERWRLAEYGARLSAENARRGEALLRAGATSPLDVSPLRVNTLLAQRTVVQARQEAEVARQRLRMLMGVQFLDLPFEPVSSQEPIFIAGTADELVHQALASRPDLHAAHWAIVANAQRAELSRYDYLNVTGVLPDINGDGDKGFEAGPGLRFAVPLFHQNQGAKARALATLEQSRRRFNTLRNNAVFDVRQAHARFQRAGQELEILRGQVVPEGNAAYQRMLRALNEDAVSTFLIMQTTDQLLTARRLELDAAAELRRATAELERSVGWRLGNHSAPTTEGPSLSQRTARQLR